MEQIFHLNKQLPPFFLKGKLLDTPTVHSLHTAQDLIEHAHTQAQSILHQAHQDKTELLNKARQQAKGHLETALKEQTATSQEKRLQETLQWEQQVAQEIEHNRQSIPSIIVEAVRHIIGDIDPNTIAKARIDAALERFHAAHTITLYLNSTQMAPLKELLAGHPLADRLKFIPQDKLEAGDSVIRSEIGTLTNRIELSIEKLQEALEAHLKTTPDTP